MKSKLTLTIDEEVKKQAKKAAKKRGVSISKIVEQYLKSISEETDNWKPREGSIVSKISGSVQKDQSGKDYSEIVAEALVKKYGDEKNSDWQ